MPTPPLPLEVRQQRKEAVDAALRDGYGRFGCKEGKGSAVEKAARDLGLKGASVANWLNYEERQKTQGKPRAKYPQAGIEALRRAFLRHAGCRSGGTPLRQDGLAAHVEAGFG